VCGAVLMAGCNGGDVAGHDDEVRQEVKRLRSQLARLETEIARQSRKIDQLGKRFAKSLEEAISVAKVAPRRPATTARTTAPPKEVTQPTTESPTPTTPERPKVVFDEFTLKVQRALKRAGYDPGPEDGKKGPRTTSALRAFQKGNNLRETGMADEATWALLMRYLE
jgi:hypothetical protein